MVAGSDDRSDLGDPLGTVRARHAAGGDGRLIANRYELFEQLGQGGMGTVWRAHDRLLARDVAAKELHVHTHGDEEHQTWLRRALREARVVARVPHPHVVGVHDLVEYEDRLWIVMELVDGPSLGQLVDREGPLAPERVAALGVQLLGALDAVHAVGALHRDVKPPNVLLRRDGSAVLTDFGIAVLDDGEFLTKPGEVAGSADYMAPERVTSGEVGPASDLWSLGATLATAATGRSPFRRNGQAATLHAVAYGEPHLDERLGPLRPVVEALLRKAPEERPSVADALAALRQVANGTGTPHTLPAASVPAGTPQAPAATPTVVSPASPADAQTQVAHSLPGQNGAPATQLYDADTMSALNSGNGSGGGGRTGSRRAGGRGWWAVAAGVVLLAGAGAGLFAAGIPPFGDSAGADAKDRPGQSERAEDAGDGSSAEPSAGTGATTGTDASAAPVTTEFSVHSVQGWQRATETAIAQGDTVTVRFTEGQWTVDDKNMPQAGPDGYDEATDASLDFAAESCKVDTAVPFAALLGRFSGAPQGGAAHVVGEEWTFQAPADGTLELRINDGKDDSAGCFSDNAGELKVSVTVVH
ncbi:serine/threonine-protein kinase [Streptomyces minutiscleroticus]|uniref:serine/threonine-protein kinase n=1 Tax=Streptomyces minutiscleroticus TaxID=68238 RepID=UPI00331A565A